MFTAPLWGGEGGRGRGEQLWRYESFQVHLISKNTVTGVGGEMGQPNCMQHHLQRMHGALWSLTR